MPPPPPPEIFLVLSCSETVSEVTELLNICFIDNTDLLLWLTYCMTPFRVQTCQGEVGWGAVPPPPLCLAY